MNQYLLANQFSRTLVYFRAGWNPHCTQTDQHAQTLAASDRQLQVIKVDTDQSPKIKRHYSVQYQPQFVFCLFGDEVLRQIGPNYQGLKQKLQKMDNLTRVSRINQIRNPWVPYGTKFDIYYRQVLYQLYRAQNTI